LYYPFFGKVGGGVGFGRVYRRYGPIVSFFFLCFVVIIGGGVGRFVPVVMVATGAWDWKGLPTRTFVFERQNCAPRHKSSKECLMVVCYRNASGNHKLKLVVIGKAKKPRLFKGTEANCIPVLHYYHNRAWMDKEIF
jgi:hypothetical protein